MKVCKYCDTCYDESEVKCPSCYAAEYSHKCNNCGKIFDSVFCPNCGTRYDDTGKKCPRCGKKYYSACCPDCGYNGFSDSQESDGEDNEPIDFYTVISPNTSGEYRSNVTVNTNQGKRVDKWISFLLCLFGGGMGFHKFYEGKILEGIIYLLTGGLFCIGWILDIIIILLKPNPYYVKKRNKK